MSLKELAKLNPITPFKKAIEIYNRNGKEAMDLFKDIGNYDNYSTIEIYTALEVI